MPKAAKKNNTPRRTASLRRTKKVGTVLSAPTRTSPAGAPARPIAAIDKKPGTFLLPTAILQQNAAVIDEQENHIVMTVRLPSDPHLDNDSLLALDRDDDFGVDLAAWLADRAAVQKGKLAL
jgi:hypothetical protein